MKIVVVSPHRDDAAFSLGLTIELWLRSGHAVRILNCFTQSEYAPYSDVETLHRNDRVSFASAVRKREDAAWNKLEGGKLQFTDLDLLDAPLRLVCAVEEVQSVSIRPGDRAVARVGGAIAKLARTAEATGVAIVLPLAIGGHIDHRIVREAAMEAVVGKALPIAFYEDLPYAARPGAMEEIEGAAHKTNLLLQPFVAGLERGDLLQCVARKRRIAECYDSQIDSETAEQIAGFCERYGGRERLWVNEVWRRSALGADAAEEASA